MNAGSDKARQRRERLAAELRANLQKRKAQARARRAGEADTRDEGLATPDEAKPPRGRGDGDPDKEVP